jgi:sulfotransferase famil protein
MLYRPTPLDFMHQILVFVHIPKTAGSALDDALKQGLGEENCLLTRAESIGQVFPDRFRKFHWSVRKALRESRIRRRGAHPLLPDGVPAARLGELRLLDGHFSLGAEPKTGREPIYLTLVRDPVDRFLSDYYYRSQWKEAASERHAYRTYDIDRFVDYVYRRRNWSETNLQCRYLGGRGEFVPAREAVDGRIFLAAPCDRIDDLLELLGPVLGIDLGRAPKMNIGRARQEKSAPSTETLTKVREMVSQDQLLFDYISREFNDLCQQATAASLKAAAI